MRLWRIGSAAFPVWSGEGARLKGGRWNAPGTPAIYAATSYASALLEIMVHANLGRVPPALRHVRIDIPVDAVIETTTKDDVPDWDAMPAGPSRRVGEAWLRGRTGLVLLVPSVVTGGLDQNALINPAHPDFSRIIVSEEARVTWDPRLTVARPQPPAAVPS